MIEKKQIMKFKTLEEEKDVISPRTYNYRKADIEKW